MVINYSLRKQKRLIAEQITCKDFYDEVLAVQYKRLENIVFSNLFRINMTCQLLQHFLTSFNRRCLYF